MVKVDELFVVDGAVETQQQWRTKNSSNGGQKTAAMAKRKGRSSSDMDDAETAATMVVWTR